MEPGIRDRMVNSLRLRKGLMLCRFPELKEGRFYLPEPVSTSNPPVEVVKSSSGELDGKKVILEKALYYMNDEPIEYFFAKESDAIAVVEG